MYSKVKQSVYAFLERTAAGAGAAASENKNDETNDKNKDCHPVEQQQEEGNGYRLHFDKDTMILPTTRNCFYCCKEGKLHPIEFFTMYPCCGQMICLDCMNKPENSKFCGECITPLPFGVNELALIWLPRKCTKIPGDHLDYNIARVYIRGTQTFVDEVMTEPIYCRKKPPDPRLVIMNPPNVECGVARMSILAQNGSIRAMLDVAEAYNTSYFNDSFQRDVTKAEYWFRRALGDRKHLSPLAFTRYGQFLRYQARYSEALEKFEVAAEYGHVRGQFEYAQMVLSEEDAGVQKYSPTEKTKAILYLCKACEKGFCIPSFTLLAKTLIRIAEDTYGSADVEGNSPLPRAIQILRRVESCCNIGYYEDGQERMVVEKEIEETLKRFEHKFCATCGSADTTEFPLRSCDRCGVSRYCSKICQRKHFRGGHKYDCCDEDNLFDFDSGVKNTLPWTKMSAVKGNKKQMQVPLLRGNDNTKTKDTLIEMVEDDTDEIYAEDDPDYDEFILAQLMLRMRKNLEVFLLRNLPASPNDEDGSNHRPNHLYNHIVAFSKMDHVSDTFVETMHKIREYGNIAAHCDVDEISKLDRTLCQNTVRSFRHQKRQYQQHCMIQSRSTPVLDQQHLEDQSDATPKSSDNTGSKVRTTSKQRKKNKKIRSVNHQQRRFRPTCNS